MTYKALPRPPAVRYKFLAKIDVHHVRRFVGRDLSRFVECLATTVRYEKDSIVELSPRSGFDNEGEGKIFYCGSDGWAFSGNVIEHFENDHILARLEAA